MQSLNARIAILAIFMAIVILTPVPVRAGEDDSGRALSLVMFPPRASRVGENELRVLPILAREELARAGIIVIDPPDKALDPEKNFGRALNDTITRGATSWGYLVLRDNPGDDLHDVAVLRVFNLRAEGLEIGSGGLVSLDEETSFTQRLDKLSLRLRNGERVREHLAAGLRRLDSTSAVPGTTDPLDTKLLFRRRAELVRALAAHGRLGGAEDWSQRLMAAERDIAAGHVSLGFKGLEDWFAHTKSRPRPRWNPQDGAETKMVCFESMLSGLVAIGGVKKAPAEMKPLLAQHRACVELLEKGEFDVLDRRLDAAGVAGNVLVERLVAENDRKREELAKRGKGQLNEAPPPAGP